MKQHFNSSANPTDVPTHVFEYKVEDKDLAAKLPSSTIQYNSCDIESLIKQMMADSRIANALKWEPITLRNSRDERVYEGVETADMYHEMHRATPVGFRFFPVTLYADETWLSQNGFATCKPLVMAPSALPKQVYNQVCQYIMFKHFKIFLTIASCRITASRLYCTSVT